MALFAWILVGSVPLLYGLFWWLDYRWLSETREQELAAPPSFDDEEETF